MKTSIQLHNLSRTFGALKAVDDLNFEVYEGEVFGLLGHNGAGKTTAIRLLNGVLDPSKGSALVLGLNPWQEGARLRARTGVLTETPAVDERLTAREHLSLFADIFGVAKSHIPVRVKSLLEQFDLSSRANERSSGYSKGMKQRLAIARVLLHDPELLFLDEPTSGLDPVASKAVQDLIQQESKESGRTVLICTHNLREAQTICDRVAVMQRGKILALGTPNDLITSLSHPQSLELELDQDHQQRAMDHLTAMGFNEIEIAGTVLRVMGIKYNDIPEVIANLVGLGIRIFKVNATETNLEDVYFSFYSQENR